MADSAKPDDAIARQIEAAKALKAALGADAEDAELLHDMIEGETDLFEMIDGVVDAIGQDKELLEGIAAREKDLRDRKERIKYRMEGRKAKIEQAMIILGDRKLERPEVTLSLSKRADKLVIENESDVPTQFFKRQDPVLDKKGLTAALKALTETDEPIPGARLEPSPDTLSIRSK
ncbi:siphovirus Gp157 family protein [Henriciella aquimarina]|uniref:siphovirus Gp157 family protein n=1 Tax=Henriciella aquimarina TaxID=545261 RepID=UPI001301DA81|nr:siphovirus Gp157 family protein [Henriciella aquimarina]